MVKKVKAYIFLVIANVVFLTYAVIPHHHHLEQICVLTSHCHNDLETQKHHSCDHQHEHDNNQHVCALNQPAIKPSNQTKQECKCFVLGYNSYPSDFSLFSFLNTAGTEAFRSAVCAHHPVPALLGTYSDFVNASLGLRGPPLV